MMEDELKQWAQVWQTEDEPFDTMRENFARKTQLRALKYWGQQALVLCSIIVVSLRCLGLVLAGNFMWVIIPALIYLPIAVYFIARAHHFWRQVRIALPASPQKYLESMAHNLEIERRELHWSNKIAPWLVMFSGFLAVMVFLDLGLTKSSIMMMAFVALGAVVVVYYPKFVSAPKIRRKTLALHALRQSMGEDVDFP